jgi:ribonuclease HII
LPQDLPALLQYDQEQAAHCGGLLAGADEAGRGCWAGPVVGAAVILPDGWCPAGLDDSKKLNSRRRDELFALITSRATSWAACAVSSSRIDDINILQASLEAMARSAHRLAPDPALVLIDGLHTPHCDHPCRAVVKGDGTSAAIAAASVVAKVLRDRVMTVADRHFPGYGFAANKGYGSPDHRAALIRLGPCPWHRFSYKPIAELDQGSLF